MKDNSYSNENIVHFPLKEALTGQKPTYKLSKAAQQESLDPIDELLNEFEHFEDKTKDHFDAQELSIEIKKASPIQSPLSKKLNDAQDIKAKAALLEEVNKRIKYYLDEVELFIPKQKK